MNKTVSLLSLLLFVILVGLPSAQATVQEQETQEPSMETAEPDTQVAYERGLRLYRNRNFREALTTFTEIAQQEPDRADLQYLIGYCHLMLKEFQQSVDAFARSFENDPEFDPRTIYQN
jgi:tetratricopeptide (TPR) repeat protein